MVQEEGDNYAFNQEDAAPADNSKETKEKNETKNEEVKNYIKFSKLPELKPLISEWKGDFNYMHNIGSKFFFQTNF